MADEQVIAIIGGGIAAMTAAAYLIDCGVKPVIIARGAGATALFSGGYDLGSDGSGNSLGSIISTLKESMPGHPYQNLDDPMMAVTKGFELINRHLNLKLSPLNMDHKNLQLPLQWGGTKKTSLVAKSIAMGDLDRIRSWEKVGIAFFHQFYPFASRVLLEQYQKLIGGMVPLRLNYLKRYHDTSYQSYDFAHNFEKPGAFDRFMEHLRRGIQTTGIKGLIVPPFIGVDSFETFTDRIYQELNIEIYETLATRPSVPGIRLQRKIEQFCLKNEIEIIRGKVAGFHRQGRKITRLLITGKKSTKLTVSGVFLATGKIVGGGIIMDGKPIEPIFQLPLFYRNQPLNQMTQPLLKERMFEQHPLFSTGIKVDDDGHPVDQNGGILFENLFAGGDILHGYDFRGGSGGMGVAIASAYHSAMQFYRYIREQLL